MEHHRPLQRGDEVLRPHKKGDNMEKCGGASPGWAYKKKEGEDEIKMQLKKKGKAPRAVARGITGV
jgi:hypothetical protein